MTTIMNDWYENKKTYIKWFGGKLIYEYGRVEFHLDKERKQDLIKEFLEQAGNYLLDDEFEQLSNFILKNMSSFFDNIVSCDSNPAKKGMKLSKAFKYFIQNKETLDKVQQIASMYIQKDKVSGTLCFSVHPLDFLSSSENTYNWRSCHALNGDFRAGNLSYMCDESTICCYIKGDGEEVLPHFPESIPWNSKKWRMLIYLDPEREYCFLGRQYPYALEDIYEIIREILPGQFKPFTDYNILNIPNLGYLPHKMIALNTPTGLNLFKIDEVIEDVDNPLHFNDLLYSSVYTPYYSSKDFYFTEKRNPPKIRVGHKINCLCCGNRRIEGGEGLMVCTTCAAENGLDFPDGYIYCSNCGEAVPEDDIYYTHNGEAICESCVNSGDYVGCCSCGDLIYYDEIIYSEKYDNYYCNECFKEIADEEYEFRRAHGLED